MPFDRIEHVAQHRREPTFPLVVGRLGGEVHDVAPCHGRHGTVGGLDVGGERVLGSRQPSAGAVDRSDPVVLADQFLGDRTAGAASCAEHRVEF